MKKGIGPQGLGAPKSAAKMYNSPAKKKGPEGKVVNTDELGRKGSFNPYEKRTAGENKFSSRVDSDYSKDYQNKVVGKYTKTTLPEQIGHQEKTRRRKHRADNVMGLRAEAYQARENNFGVKKPKAKIK